jgi:hypothetical protein
LDLNRLTRGEQILGISALVLFITSFLSLWGSYEVSADLPEGVPEIADTSVSTSFSLWSGYGILPKLGVVIAFLLVVLVVAKAAGALDNANLPLPAGLIYLGGSAITVLTMILALLAGPEGDNDVSVGFAEYEQKRGLLLFLGVALSLAMAVGSFLHFSGGDTSAPRTTGGPPPGPPGT